MSQLTLGSGKDVTFEPLKLDRLSDLMGISLQFADGAAMVSGQLGTGDRERCSRQAVYLVGMKPKGDGILLVQKSDECQGSNFRFYSVAPGRYFVITLPTGVVKDIAQSWTKSAAVDDDKFRLIEKAAKRMKAKFLIVEERQAYWDVVPMVDGVVSQP